MVRERSSEAVNRWAPSSADPVRPLTRQRSPNRSQVDAGLAVEDQKCLSIDVELDLRQRREELLVEVAADDPAGVDGLVGQRRDGCPQPPARLREPGPEGGHILLEPGV